jgi:Skp family chaperone for outer membrane proteins
MCEFVSWIEKSPKKILFMTDDLIFNTEKGKLLQKQCSKYDLQGHGAIRFYFGLESEEGKQKECSDFSDSASFPKAIVAAIKAGQMFRMAENPPLGLLTPAAQADYRAKHDALYADYEAKHAPLDADYRAKHDALDADYRAKHDALYADYEAKRAPLYADYRAKHAPLYADYRAKRAPLFKEIFMDVRNRAHTWG